MIVKHVHWNLWRGCTDDLLSYCSIWMVVTMRARIWNSSREDNAIDCHLFVIVVNSRRSNRLSEVLYCLTLAQRGIRWTSSCNSCCVLKPSANFSRQDSDFRFASSGDTHTGRIDLLLGALHVLWKSDGNTVNAIVCSNDFIQQQVMVDVPSVSRNEKKNSMWSVLAFD